MSFNEILTLYQKNFSEIENTFPIDSQRLYLIHKSALNTIYEKFNIKNLSLEAEKQIELEFNKISNKNNEIYKSKLLNYLSDKFKDIDGSVHSGYYKSIDEYERDINKFKDNIINDAPEGPNKEALIFKFILDQIMIDTEIIINSNISNYEDELNNKENILKTININIKDSKDEADKIIKEISIKEEIIKKFENDKTDMIKLSSNNADKLSKILKEKGNEIQRLNDKIEEGEKNNLTIINELKEKIKKAELNQNDKEKIVNSSKNEFEKKKIELENKIEVLEKQIKNANEAKVLALKNLTKDLLLNTQNSEIEKFQNQIIYLNKKIEKLNEKNIELSSQLLDKEKSLEFEKKKSQKLIFDYEEKIKEATNEHDNIEEQIKKIQDEENENLQNLKSNYETKIGEMKGNYSKSELLYEANLNNLNQLIENSNEELNNLKEENEKNLNKLEELKSQSLKDKVDYDKYIKILEENYKRILSQYEDCVKENNNLKAQQESDIIRINGETENKIVKISKENEKLTNDINSKNIEFEKNEKELNEKIIESEKKIPILKERINELNIILDELKLNKKNKDIEFEEQCEKLKEENEKELEILKEQYEEDIINNNQILEKNIEFAKNDCEQQKKELLEKMKENEELNIKNQEELIKLYEEKIIILEQVKNEKIEDLKNEITEIEQLHKDYIEKTEEELIETEEQINKSNNELKETSLNLSTIHSTFNTVLKSNYEKFKNEKDNLKDILNDLKDKYNETCIQISIYKTQNDNLNSKIQFLNEQINKANKSLEEIKEKNETKISSLNNDIIQNEKELVNIKTNFDQQIALKNQEIDYINSQIQEKKEEFEEFQKSFDEKIKQCRTELIEEYSLKLDEIKKEKNELENNLNQKKKEFKEIEFNYQNKIALLTKEKEVLIEKLNNIFNQRKELELNLEREKEENLKKINSYKKEYKDRNDQLIKENEVINGKLSKILSEYNEMNEIYDKDKILWENKYKKLLEEKKNGENELNALKEKYNSNIEDLQMKFQNEIIDLQQIYNDAITKRDDKFNTQITNANKAFAQKMEYIINLNHELTLKNRELLDTLNKYENKGNLKDKENKLFLSLESAQKYKENINNISNLKDKQIEDLQTQILSERREFTNKIIELEKKIKEYEMKRSSFAADSLKQKSNSEKDSNEQNLQIERLKNRISSLEKANFRLQIDNRDVVKDNKNLRRKSINHSNSNSLSFIPKYKITYSGKENVRTQSNIPIETLNTGKKNLLNKFNQKDDDNDSEYNFNSKEGSIIINSSDIEDK